MTGDHRPLLSVRDLQVRFPVRTDRGKGVVQAVAGIDFDIHRGQTVSLVGESGSGKSTVANALMPGQGHFDPALARTIAAEVRLTPTG